MKGLPISCQQQVGTNSALKYWVGFPTQSSHNPNMDLAVLWHVPSQVSCLLEQAQHCQSAFASISVVHLMISQINLCIGKKSFLCSYISNENKSKIQIIFCPTPKYTEKHIFMENTFCKLLSPAEMNNKKNTLYQKVMLGKEWNRL